MGCVVVLGQARSEDTPRHLHNTSVPTLMRKRASRDLEFSFERAAAKRCALWGTLKKHAGPSPAARTADTRRMSLLPTRRRSPPCTKCPIPAPSRSCGRSAGGTREVKWAQRGCPQRSACSCVSSETAAARKSYTVRDVLDHHVRVVEKQRPCRAQKVFE